MPRRAAPGREHSAPWRSVGLVLVRVPRGLEQRRRDLAGIEHELAVVRRVYGRSRYDEVACALDVDDDVVGGYRAHGSDLLATLLQVDLVADLDRESTVRHAWTIAQIAP